MSSASTEVPTLTVVVPNLIGLHTAEPLLRALGKRSTPVAIIAPSNCLALIETRLAPFRFQLIDYRAVFDRQRLARMWHAALMIALTPKSFSQGYFTRTLGGLLTHKSAAVRIAVQLLTMLPKARAERVNRLLYRLTRPIVSSPFPCADVLCITRVADSHLLCSAHTRVVTMVESWDHPSKAPLGYPSDLVFVWNDALAADWKRYQGDKTVQVGYPIKLAYALAAGQACTVKTTWRNGRLLYPATYSSYSATGLFDEELVLIEQLCRAAKKANLRVFVKPKPNGREGEFDHLAEKHPNLDIGYETGVPGPADYFPTEEYNASRLALMRQCDAVVNLATTFALDSAAFGLPIFQLEICAPATFPKISENFSFQHLSYFTSDVSLTYRVTDSASIETVVGPDLGSRHAERAESMSRGLRRWLIGPRAQERETLSDAAERIVSMVLARRSNAPVAKE